VIILKLIQKKLGTKINSLVHWTCDDENDEKEFAKEIEELSVQQKKTVLRNSKIASKILASYNKTI